MYYDLEWFPVDNPPPCQCRVLIMASSPAYNFGHPQLLTGYYVDKYYDTPLNEFRITGVNDSDWVPIKWAYAPTSP